jgi:hypothetical protein
MSIEVESLLNDGVVSLLYTSFIIKVVSTLENVYSKMNEKYRKL